MTVDNNILIIYYIFVYTGFYTHQKVFPLTKQNLIIHLCHPVPS